jgi:hypothetical protein
MTARLIWNWLLFFCGAYRVQPKTRASIVADLRDTALKEAAEPEQFLLTLAPCVRAQVEEISQRLDCSRGQVLSLGLATLMNITEGGNTEFTVERCGETVTYAIRASEITA